MSQSIAYRPAEYKEMVDAMFTPNPKLPCKPMIRGAVGKVYRIEAQQSFVVKVNPEFNAGEYRFYAELSEAIATPEQVTPRIVYWEQKDIDGNLCGVQVYPYLTGERLDHVPIPEESSVIGETIYELHQRLCEVTPRFDRVIGSIDPVLRSILDRLEKCAIRERGYRLLENPRYRELISQEEEYLIAWDLNPTNILLDHRADGLRVRIIDLALFYGPAVMQPASFAACFMILHNELSSLKTAMNCWPEPLDKRDVLLMMQPWFLIVGAAREYMLANHNTSEPEHQRAVVNRMVRYTDIISTEL